MKLQVKNFLAVHNAEIEIESISIIAGKNGTGKSTIAKAFFLFIKAYNQANSISNKIFLDHFFGQELEQLGYETSVRLSELIEIMKPLFQHIADQDYVKAREVLIDIEKNILEKSPKKLSSSGTLRLNQIKNFINTSIHDVADSSVFHLALSKLISDVFGHIIQTEPDKEGFSSKSKILFESKDLIKAWAEFFSGTSAFSYDVEYLNSEKKNIDVSFYSTPVIMDLADSILSSRTYASYEEVGKTHEMSFFSKPNTSIIYKDLCLKLKIIAESGAFSKDSSAVGAYNFKYSEIRKGFVELINFTEVPTISSASGKKSFALINGLISYHKSFYTSLIILDEPEVHLHPEAQVQLAQLIVEANKENGTLFLINSHSNFFIESLHAASIKNEITSMNFYFPQQDKKTKKFSFKKNEENLHEILKSFVSSYDEINKIYEK